MPAAQDVVILRVPRASWSVLRETLEMDSQSHAFARPLRRQIARALATVQEEPNPPELHPADISLNTAVCEGCHSADCRDCPLQ